MAPHRLADRLLSLLFALVPSWTRDALRGDLDEEYCWRAARDGRWSARAWYLREALVLAVRYAPERWRGAPESPHGAIGAPLSALLVDLRHAGRALAAQRSFAALSIVCLALGIGTTTAGFAFVNAIVLQPLPVPRPERLIEVRLIDPRQPTSAAPISTGVFRDLGGRLAGVADLAAMRRAPLRLSDGPATERIASASVSSNYFRMLGIQPVLGRGFDEQDEQPGAPPVALLSHTVWERRYERDPFVIGRAIRLNGRAHTVVGVMPRELSQVAMERVLDRARLWVPLQMPVADDGSSGLTVYGRLADSVDPPAARTRIAAIRPSSRLDDGDADRAWSADPLHVGISATTRGMAVTAMGGLTFILLIGCANVANLTLARVTGRRREIATRLALGAPRIRVARQLLIESLILAFAALPAGVAFAYGCRALLLSAAATPDIAAAVTIDPRVLLFSAAVAVAASLLSGAMPALHAVRRVDQDLLRTGRRGISPAPRHQRLTGILVMGEVALAMMLVVGASLFLQSFRNLLGAEGGFDTSRILALRVGIDENGTRRGESFRVTDLVDTLAHLGGVTHAAAASFMPLRDGGSRATVVRETAEGDARPAAALVGGITSEFFTVIGVPLVEGRPLTALEARTGADVAVINRTMARRLWPDRSAIGRQFRIAGGALDAGITVVGVSADVLSWDLGSRPLPAAYVPLTRTPVSEPNVFLRAERRPSRLAGPARAAVRAFEPAWPVVDVRTMTEIHHRALARQGTLAWLLTALGGIAVILGGSGVYGVLSYVMSQRRAEIGIRAALGADRRTLVTAFLRQGMQTAAWGVGVGVAGSWAAGRIVQGRLHEVSATEPARTVAAGLVLLVVAGAATYLAARRAASIDPLTAIRD